LPTLLHGGETQLGGLSAWKMSWQSCQSQARDAPRRPRTGNGLRSLSAPKPPARRIRCEGRGGGRETVGGKARCASCHVPPLFTEPGWNLHKAEDIGIDDFQAERSPDDRYRTAPLRALWDTKQIHKGGFYHDGALRLCTMSWNITTIISLSLSPNNRSVI
jgi:hypothetical protein